MKDRKKGGRRRFNSDACPEENETGMFKHRIGIGEIGKDREGQQRR